MSISQKDLDAINDYYWGINFDPKFETSDVCWNCQGDGYLWGLKEHLVGCPSCEGVGLIERENHK